MDSHVKALGWLWIITGVFSLGSAICAGFGIGGSGFISDDQTSFVTTSIVGVICGGSLLFGGILDLIAAYGLFNFKSWARILAIILGILNLFLFPIGTALGIYTLWVLIHRDVEPVFAGR